MTLTSAEDDGAAGAIVSDRHPAQSCAQQDGGHNRMQRLFQGVVYEQNGVMPTQTKKLRGTSIFATVHNTQHSCRHATAIRSRNEGRYMWRQRAAGVYIPCKPLSNSTTAAKIAKLTYVCISRYDFAGAKTAGGGVRLNKNLNFHPKTSLRV